MRLLEDEEPPKAEDQEENEQDPERDQDQNEAEEDEEIDDFDEEAYRALDAQLDRLNSALDAIEEKNDQIHAAAKDLLKSNREMRSQEQNEDMDQDPHPKLE